MFILAQRRRPVGHCRLDRRHRDRLHLRRAVRRRARAPRSRCASGLRGARSPTSRAHRDAVPAAFAEPHRARRAPEGRRLHGRASSASACSKRSSTPSCCVALTLGGGLAALVAWTETSAVPPLWRDVAAVRRRRRHLRRRQPAVLVVADVPHRGALRLQPHDAGRCGSPTSPRACRRPPSSACRCWCSCCG